MTINVRIKTIPPSTPGGEPRSVTTKVFLVEQKMIEGVGFPRALEPGDVVALKDEVAMEYLKKLPFELEMTAEEPTRPLYFENRDIAHQTSRNFNPRSAGRAEEAKAAMAKVLAEAQAPEAQAELKRVQELDAREAALVEREKALGLMGPTPEELLDAELADTPAANNALSPEDMRRIKAAAELEAGEGDEVNENLPLTSKYDDDELEPVKPRRRRGATAKA